MRVIRTIARDGWDFTLGPTRDMDGFWRVRAWLHGERVPRLDFASVDKSPARDMLRQRLVEALRRNEARDYVWEQA